MPGALKIQEAHSELLQSIEHSEDGVLKSFEQRPLRDLDFMDVYVCLDDEIPAHYRPSTGNKLKQIDIDVPAEFYDAIKQLSAHLRAEFDQVEKAIVFQGMRLRAAKLWSASGHVWAAMRRINDKPLALDKLRMPSQMLNFLREIGQRDGLIFITGATGDGKTTTASSLLMEYLTLYGGVAFTIEDPVEYTMEGRVGEAGYCYQSEIRDEPEWGRMLKRSLRWHPRYIVVGEIRTPDAANQLLRAATSGHTVLTTMHAGSMEEGLEGLLQLAEIELGPRAPMLLAAGLTAVIHQKMTPIGLNVHMASTEADNLGSPVRTMIREKYIGQIRTYSDQQMAQLMKGEKIFFGR